MFSEETAVEKSQVSWSGSDERDESICDLGERLSVTVRRDGVCGDVFSWWWHQIEQFDLLTPERETQLAIRIREGDAAAFEEMVESNLRLVVAIARRCHAYSSASIDLIDLIQEGTIGLIKAARKFDHRRGYKFSTYATYWIRQAIMRAMNDSGRTIRLPTHVAEKVFRVERVRLSMTHSLLRLPTNPELAHYMDMSLEGLQKLFESALDPVSLDIAPEETDSSQPNSLEDRFTDLESPATSDSALDSVVRDQICDTLRRAMEGLPEPEAAILSLRYGLNGGPTHSLEEVAGRFKVTRKRVRQLESSGLNRLRSCGHLREIAQGM